MTTTQYDAFTATALEICQSIDDAHRGMTRGKADLLIAIRRFEELELAREVGARTTAQWLTRRYGMSKSTAHEYVSVAHRLAQFPYLEHHFAQGDICYSVVRLLLKYLTEDNERELVEMAFELGYHELEIALAGRGRPGESEDAPEYYLRLHPNPDGLKLHGFLNPADAAAFMAALKLGEIAYNGLEDLLDGEPATDESAVERARAAAAEIEPVTKPRKMASGYGLPLGRELVQALMGMVHMVRANPKTPLATPAAHVNIVATHDGRAYMPNNVGVPSAAVANVVANACVRLSTVNDEGLILNTTRARRLATPAQINALMVMWGGQCAAPGCTHNRFMEMHHINKWEHGGHTDLDNLLPLCSSCHSLVTEGYLRIVKERSSIHFIYRDGTRYVSDNYSMARRRDDALTEQEYRELVEAELAFEAASRSEAGAEAGGEEDDFLADL